MLNYSGFTQLAVVGVDLSSTPTGTFFSSRVLLYLWSSRKQRENLLAQMDAAIAVIEDDVMGNERGFEDVPHLTRIVQIECLVGAVHESALTDSCIRLNQHKARFRKIVKHAAAILFLNEGLRDDKVWRLQKQLFDAVDDIVEKGIAQGVINRALGGNSHFHSFGQIVIAIVEEKTKLFKDTGDIGFSRAGQAKGDEQLLLHKSL